MDDRPVSGVGAYKINWDEIDEMSNPFGSGGKGLPVKNQPKSVTEPSPQGGRSNDNINQPTNLSVDSNPEKLPKKSPQNPQPLPKSLPKSNNSTEVKQSPNPPSSEASPVVVNEQDVPKNVQKGNIPQCNGELLATPTPQSIPSPEEICEALQSVIYLQSDINPNVGNNLEVAQDHSNESDPSLGEPVENNVENSNVVPDVMQTSRIDSSTRPASPAQAGMLNKSDTPLVNGKENSQLPPQYPFKSSRDSKSNDSELIALRKERDQLLTTIEEMKHCITEYDRSLQHMVEEKAHSQREVNIPVADLIKERDEAVEELATIEKAFGDLHRRFEKSKQIIEGFKQNEEALKKSIDEYKSLLQRQERKYLALKKHAEDQLLKVNQDTEGIKQEYETNLTRLQASLRISELQVKSFESQLQQKTRENEELTKICDELLSKYGGIT
ncbi:putative transforming acidic coiled-coil containing protein 1/2 [Schistosoma mansoni]|uniref:putative transforming acidic coiled-coil containing protein 1/2 n=1 Tax=Schistosoma mansoni TaxID=6183 RepID=UPI00022DC0F4|nr:putative transforming acidic coiled-coil containing protein 1/2 [Schistosoma mansoni]|eukprot:XP_018651980.1 putative transforming acidic coiled-coil containing protein 1/2 [Schistosoma mansoni]